MVRSSKEAVDSPSRCSGAGAIFTFCASKCTGKVKVACQKAGIPRLAILTNKITTKVKLASMANKPRLLKTRSRRRRRCTFFAMRSCKRWRGVFSVAWCAISIKLLILFTESTYDVQGNHVEYQRDHEQGEP